MFDLKHFNRMMTKSVFGIALKNQLLAVKVIQFSYRDSIAPILCLF